MISINITPKIPTILEPGRECIYCSRIVNFRHTNRAHFPMWHNAPVPSFGSEDSWLLVVGLAPGLQGANRTGRPFTGDFAGILLYTTLMELGLAEGFYQANTDDGLHLNGCRITNAVRCVPPKNKPLLEETKKCSFFLRAEITAMPHLRAVVALGRTAHESVISACSLKKSALPFRHGGLYRLENGLIIADSYHCSRYNTQTGRLTYTMFQSVFQQVLKVVDLHNT